MARFLLPMAKAARRKYFMVANCTNINDKRFVTKTPKNQFKPVFYSRIASPLAKNLVRCSFTPSAKSQTEVHKYQRLEKQNKFFQCPSLAQCLKIVNYKPCLSNVFFFLNFSELDLQNSPLFIGGVSSLDVIFANSGHVSSHDFVGCMRDVYLDNIALDVNLAVSKYGITNSCPRVPECNQNSCHGDSTCIDHWFTTFCQCTNDMYSGPQCNKSEYNLSN